MQRLKQCKYFVILCRCETWSLTQKKERRSRMFENMALRKICGHKRDEVMGLEEITLWEALWLCSVPSGVWVVKSRKWGGQDLWHDGGARRGVYKVLVGKLYREKPIGRPRPELEDNERYLKQMNVAGGMDWNNLVEDCDSWWADVNKEMNREVP
jgi:hypothetical protein